MGDIDDVIEELEAGDCRHGIPGGVGCSECEAVEDFEPDHDLIVKVAEYLMDVPRGQAYMVTAYGVLIHLHDLGIELPDHHDSDGPSDG